VAPIVIFAWRKLRESDGGLLLGAIVGLLGLALNRANVSMFAIWRPAGTIYRPSWMEVAILAGALAGATLVFALAARLLPLLGPADGEQGA